MQTIAIREKGITWSNDIGKKFVTGNPNTTWIDAENEHFIVWMRTAGLPEFRKLWGVIDNGISLGTYTFMINNNYNPNVFGGSKDIIFSTAGVFGGKNMFIEICFWVLFGLCLLMSVILIGMKVGGWKYVKKMQ